jgi:hypothetical protein
MSKIDTYEPTLICLGIISASLEDARSAVQSQLESIKKKPFSSTLESTNWEQFFKDDGRFYEIMHVEIALFSPREGLTVYVCNLADGWVSLYENLVKANAFDAHFFRATLAERAKYEVFEMITWRHGARVRQVRALQEEDGWGFLNKGDPLPFEDVERYEKRRISTRLDRKLIERYSESVGYNIGSITKFDGKYWRFWRNG